MKSGLSGDWDLAYAVPGCAPRGTREQRVILHQATRHPATVRAALAPAVARTGGRGFMTAGEQRLLERELDRVDVVHVTTRAVGLELEASGIPASKIVHAYPGIDLERFRPAPKPKDVRVAFVGPLSLWKGVDVVALLARELSGRATVLTVGGPVCRWSKAVVNRALFAPRSTVADALAEARALVLPSLSDGFGYVVLEALAAGTVPFVTPEVGAAEVLMELEPRLVIARDEFAVAVPKLLASLDLASIAIRGRTLAERFERGEMARQAVAAILVRAGNSHAN